jgi:hypothetical protein
VRASRRTYALTSVSILAVIALIVDRAMTNGPQSASAYAIDRPAAGAARKATAAAPPRAASADAAPGPTTRPDDWLGRLPDAPEVRDLFATAKALGENGAGAVAPSVDPAAEFVAAHRLEATFRDASLGCAVVDGRIVRRGQKTDGFTLVAVDAFQAVFRQGQHEAVLTMEQPTAGPETRPSKKQ